MDSNNRDDYSYSSGYHPEDAREMGVEYDITVQNNSMNFQPGDVPNMQSTQVVKKRMSKKWMIALIAIVLVVGSITAVIAYMPVLQNSFRLLMLSEEEYYAKVETDEMESLFDSVSTNLSIMDVLHNEGTLQCTGNFKLGHIVVDILRDKGIEMKGLEFTGESKLTSNDGEFQILAEVVMNGNPFISGDIILDREDVIYLGAPALNSGYLTIDFKEIVEKIYRLTGYRISTDDIEDFLDILRENDSQIDGSGILERYLDIAVEELKVSSMKKNKTFKDRHASMVATEIKIEIDANDITSILNAVLDEAEDDDELYEFVTSYYPIPSSVYDMVLSYIRKGVTSLQYDLDDIPDMSMKVYVNSLGEIVGRIIEIDNYEFRMHRITEESTVSYNLSVRDIYHDCAAGITGVIEDGKGKLTLYERDYGEERELAIFNVSDFTFKSLSEFSGTFETSLQVEQLDWDIRKFLGYTGDESDMVLDMVRLKAHMDFNHGNIACSLAAGINSKDNLFEAEVSVGETGKEKIRIPDDTYEFYEISDFFKTIDFTKFIDGISEVIGSDALYLQDILEESVKYIQEIIRKH